MVAYVHQSFIKPESDSFKIPYLLTKRSKKVNYFNQNISFDRHRMRVDVERK